MRDIITLKGVSAHGIHGVYDFEHTVKQLFLVDVAIWVDFSTATAKDDIGATVSYSDIARDVVSIIEGPSVRLIETLAQRIVERVMAYPRVEGALVTVHKPQAPMEQDFADVSVSVRRGITDISAFEELLSIAEEGDHAQAGHSSHKSPGNPLAFPSAPPSVDEPVRRPVASAPSIAVDMQSGAAHARHTSQPDEEERTTNQPVAVSSEEPFVLAFGGNEGNVPVTLVSALELLMKDNFINIDNISPLLRTAAVVKPGMEAQEDYWNMVVVGRTRLTPHKLLEVTSAIESVLGRQRPFEWAPRTIDIDLIRVGNHVISDEVLQLPHPRAYARAFVLVPWLLADPHAELPGYAPLSDLIAAAEDRHGIIDVIDQWYLEPGTVIEKSNAVQEALTQGLRSVDEAVGSHFVEPASEPVVASDEGQPFAVHLSPVGEGSVENPAIIEPTRPAPSAPRRPRTRVKPVQRDFAAEWDAFVKTVDFSAPAQESSIQTELTDAAADLNESMESFQSEDPFRNSGKPTLEDEAFPESEVRQSVLPQSGRVNPADLSSYVASPGVTAAASAPADDIFDLDALAATEAGYTERSNVDDHHDRRPALTHVPSFDEALESEPTSTVQTHISWIPVSAAIPVITETEADDLPIDQEFISDRVATADTASEKGESSAQEVSVRPVKSRPLPSWNFSQRVNVIDSIDDNESPSTPDEDSENTTLGAHSGQVVLDPQLPSGMEVGALPQTQVPAANLSRKSVLRPTHTGAIPIVKRRP